MYQAHIVIVGGGAAGMFAAVNCAEMYPNCQVTLLEKGKRLLEKVKISGGGRCNVTHACFEPAELVKHYPRGNKELLAPFKQFQPSHTISWFKQHGVTLKTEADGRMFPISNSSQTIIDCLMQAAQRANVRIYTQSHVIEYGLPNQTQSQWELKVRLNDATTSQMQADVLLIATGSSPQMWQQIAEWRHNIVPPIPSLFTFHIKDPRLHDLLGVSVPNVALQLVGTNLKTEGALLITHWGLSGPAVLRLSAFGAIALQQKQYNAGLKVNFVPEYSPPELLNTLQNLRQSYAKKNVIVHSLFNLPLRLWQALMRYIAINEAIKWADLSNKQLQLLADVLQNSQMNIKGKSTFKEEFVTCGGVELKEIDFRTMQSRIVPRLFFAGEVLNIDAVTGGFNFQAAWTTAFIAAQNMGKGL